MFSFVLKNADAQTNSGPNIYAKVCNNSKQLIAVNYYWQALYFQCLLEPSIYLGVEK